MEAWSKGYGGAPKRFVSELAQRKPDISSTYPDVHFLSLYAVNAIFSESVALVSRYYYCTSTKIIT